jgi:hypothetical protein
LWDGADVKIYSSDLNGNTARYGGAIHNQFGNSELDLYPWTVLRNNRAQVQGGGIFNAGSAFTTLSQVALLNNQATDIGGGIYNSFGSVRLFDCSLFGNSAAEGVGGGVFTELGVAEIVNSTLENNSAVFGGGIFNYSGEATLWNTTLSSNFSDSGGGIYNHDHAITNLYFVTLSGNVASNEGGGIYNSDVNTTLGLKNTIVADSDSGDCFGKPASNALFSLWSDNSCAFTSGAGNKPNTPALLAPLADNGGHTLTQMLIAGSPALDAGQCDVNIPNDQRGVSRPQGLACDIGAVERQSSGGNNLVFLPLLSK